MKTNRHGPAMARTLFLLTFLVAACQSVAAPTSSPSGSPRPTPTPAPTPVAEWARFTSERYGYAVDHPIDWVAKEKVGTPVFSILRPFNAGADVITSTDSHRYFSRDGLQVAAAAVEPGATLETFTNDVHMPCGGPSFDEVTTLGGEPAIERRFRCDGNTPFYVQFTALHGDLGYVVWFMSSWRPHADDRPEYEAMRESFAFTDPTAASGD